ncbi:MAG: hypothetical protein JXB04_08955 [Kiritimatiellae bacterium]|nr:hypothetical protein [Kiritimatiellia bacterium]
MTFKNSWGLLAAAVVLSSCAMPQRPVEILPALDDPDRWPVVSTEGARVELSLAEEGGLRVAYDIPSGGGWVAVERPLLWRLDADARLRLDVTATGDGIFEVKLFPFAGGIYGVKMPITSLPPGILEIPRADFEHWDGVPGSGRLDLSCKFGFAVSATSAARGEVVVRSVAGEGIEYLPRPFEPLDVARLSDDELLDEVQKRTVRYFWETSEPTTGVAIEHEHNASDLTQGKVAATGFGLAAICIGIERGWIDRAEGYERILRTLRFFENSPGPDGWVTTGAPAAPRAEGRWGLWYHFVHRQTGKWDGSDCVAICDSSDFVAGLVVCRAYFPGTEVAALAGKMLDAIEWDRFILPPDNQGRRFLSFGFLPKGGSSWAQYRNDPGDRLLGPMLGLGDNSLLIYFMAMGSATHTLPRDVWDAYVSTYEQGEYGGHHCLVAGQSFSRQVPLAFMGLRGWRAQGVDYFADLARSTLAQRQFGIDSGHYHENLWGFDDCFHLPGATYEHRAPPGPVIDDGTIATAGFAASAPFVPGPVLAAIRHAIGQYGDRIFGPYGFTSSLNPERDYFCPFVVGIGTGPIVIALENLRSGMIWNLFMSDPVAQTALRRIGFEPVIDDFELPAEAPPYAAWEVQGGSLEVVKAPSPSGWHHLDIRPTASGGALVLTARPFAMDRSGFGRLAFRVRGHAAVAVELREGGGRRIVPTLVSDEPLSGAGEGWRALEYDLGRADLRDLAEIEFRLEPASETIGLDDVFLTGRP